MNKIKEKLQQINPLENNLYIEIFNKNEVVLTGDVEIIKLEKSVLKIKNDEQEILFFGDNIEILSYDTDGLRLKSNLNKIEFFSG